MLCHSLSQYMQFLKHWKWNLKHFAVPTLSLNSLRFKNTNGCTAITRSTIYALSTAPGMSAVAVLRISGPKASEVLFNIGKLKKLPEARKVTLCRLKDPESNEILDKALVVWFPAPHSYTGEDVCELHVHGGTAVVKSILKSLQKLPHFRSAEPGEFTKRAFMSGKLDLTEVEGLADLLHAETEAQQKQALRQMDGALHKLYSDWTGRVKKCLAKLEAYIDFSEDQHLEDTILTSIRTDLESLKSEISSHLLDKRKGEKLRNGVFAVLVGRPNVGKSSLLNSLCKRDIAIVSSTAGTTRDIIESSVNLDGYLVNICDTAGIRDTSNAIEQEGVNRAKKKSSQADMLIFIIEAKRALRLMESHNFAKTELIGHLMCEELGENFIKTLNSAFVKTDDDKTHQCNEGNLNTLLLLNKMDLLSEDELQKVGQLLAENRNVISAVSCTEGTGMNEFVQLFADRVKEICCGHRGEEPTITQERHRHCVEKCFQYLLEYEESVEIDIAIAADKLRCAINELGKITGKITTNDILDIIFKDFCIGK